MPFITYLSHQTAAKTQSSVSLLHDPTSNQSLLLALLTSDWTDAPTLYPCPQVFLSLPHPPNFSPMAVLLSPLSQWKIFLSQNFSNCHSFLYYLRRGDPSFFLRSSVSWLVLVLPALLTSSILYPHLIFYRLPLHWIFHIPRIVFLLRVPFNPPTFCAAIFFLKKRATQAAPTAITSFPLPSSVSLCVIFLLGPAGPLPLLAVCVCVWWWWGGLHFLAYLICLTPSSQ